MLGADREPNLTFNQIVQPYPNTPTAIAHQAHDTLPYVHHPNQHVHFPLVCSGRRNSQCLALTSASPQVTGKLLTTSPAVAHDVCKSSNDSQDRAAVPIPREAPDIGHQTILDPTHLTLPPQQVEINTCSEECPMEYPLRHHSAPSAPFHPNFYILIEDNELQNAADQMSIGPAELHHLDDLTLCHDSV